jgi:hypothetical protein
MLGQQRQSKIGRISKLEPPTLTKPRSKTLQKDALLSNFSKHNNK